MFTSVFTTGNIVAEKANKMKVLFSAINYVPLILNYFIFKGISQIGWYKMVCDLCLMVYQKYSYLLYSIDCHINYLQNISRAQFE